MVRHIKGYARIIVRIPLVGCILMASQQKYSKSVIFVFGYVANHILHRNHAHTNKMPGCSSASSLSLYMPLRHALFA